jgi:hypothetical protein
VWAQTVSSTVRKPQILALPGNRPFMRAKGMIFPGRNALTATAKPRLGIRDNQIAMLTPLKN